MTFFQLSSAHFSMTLILGLFFCWQERDSEDLTVASVFGSAKATQEADNVLILQDKRLTEFRGRKYVQVTIIWVNPPAWSS